MTISLRLNDSEAALMRNYAELKNISVSELVRTAVLEKIEDEIDLELYERAHQAFVADPVTYTLTQAEKELGL